MNLIVKFNKDDVACTPHISDTSNYHKIYQNYMVEWDQQRVQLRVEDKHNEIGSNVKTNIQSGNR